MALNPENVPAAVVPLLSLTDPWGIGDDIERALLVQNASASELRKMVDAVDAVDDHTLYGWLAGPEALAPRPTPEYLAVTNLTMAADHARVRLKTLKP